MLGSGVTVKVTPLLANPPTVTTTLPLVAPVGTVTAMLVALQFVGVAGVPLKVTVLLPCDVPKFEPVIVRELPTGPLAEERLEIDGVIVKLEMLLTWFATVTKRVAAVTPLAAVGIVATIVVALQLVGVACAPPTVTVLVPCDAPKLLPVIVKDVPTGPEVGVTLLIFGPDKVTVKPKPLLA